MSDAQQDSQLLLKEHDGTGPLVREAREHHTMSLPGLAWKCRGPRGELEGKSVCGCLSWGAGCTGARAKLGDVCEEGPKN